MNKALAEYYHSRGTMPDCAYYKELGLNDQEIADIMMQKNHNEASRKLKEEQEKKEFEKQIEALAEKKIEEALNKVLEDLFKDFG